MKAHDSRCYHAQWPVSTQITRVSPISEHTPKSRFVSRVKSIYPNARRTKNQQADRDQSHPRHIVTQEERREREQAGRGRQAGTSARSPANWQPASRSQARPFHCIRMSHSGPFRCQCGQIHADTYDGPSNDLLPYIELEASAEQKPCLVISFHTYPATCSAPRAVRRA